MTTSQVIEQMIKDPVKSFVAHANDSFPKTWIKIYNNYISCLWYSRLRDEWITCDVPIREDWQEF
jgi:hypothetical protein